MKIDEKKLSKLKIIIMVYFLVFSPLVFLFSGFFPGKSIISLINILYFVFISGIYSWLIYLIIIKNYPINNIYLPFFFINYIIILSIQAFFVDFAIDISLFYPLIFYIAAILMDMKTVLTFSLLSLLISYLYFFFFKILPLDFIIILYILNISVMFVTNIFLGKERRRRLQLELAYKKLEKEAQEWTGVSLEENINPIDLISVDKFNAENFKEKRRQKEEILYNLKLLKRAIKPFSIVYFVYIPEEKKLKPWLWISDGEIDSEKGYFKEEGLIGQIFSNKPYLFLQELFNSLKGIDYYKKREDIKSFIGIRIETEKYPVGVIIMDSKNEQAFNEDHKRFLEFIIHQILFILESGDMRKHLKIELHRFRGFYELSKLISSEIKLEEIVNKVINILPSLCNYDLAFIVAKKNDNTLYIPAADGDYSDRLKEVEFPIEHSLIGYNISNNNKEHCRLNPKSSKNRDIPIIKKGLFPERDFSTLICFNLPIHNESLGSLVLFSRKEKAFLVYETKILEAISSQLAIGLKNSQLYDMMEQLAIKDGLTGVYNRRYFQQYLDKMLKELDRYQYPVTVIMFDIDYFKKVNDSYGHEAGDLVLKDFAQIISNNIRDVDIVARYGGEEFIGI